MSNRKKRRSLAEITEANRVKRLEIKKRETLKLEKSIAEKISNAKKSNKPKKRCLSAKQKEKRRYNVEQVKSDFVGYMKNKIVREKQSRAIANQKEAAIKQRQKDGLDRFTDYAELTTLFPDQQSALNEYKSTQLNANGKPTCPHCKKETTVWAYTSRQVYKCKDCGKQFRITTGSIFEKSRIPMHFYFRLIFNELFYTKLITVKQASQILKVSMKTAHAALIKLRNSAFVQDIFDIEPGSVVVIDTSAFIGENRNRQDWKKLTAKETYEKTKHVLVFKTKSGISRAMLIDELTADIILPLIEKLVGKGSTIKSDQAKVFKGISKIAGKNFKHITYNHNAGEHGDGSAESLNAILKSISKAHGNCFSKQGLQLIINSACFNSNTSGLSFEQKFSLALKNCGRSGKPQWKRGQVRRRSTFVKLAIAAAKKNSQTTLPVAAETIPAVVKIAARIAA